MTGRPFQSVRYYDGAKDRRANALCGAPVDSEYFDDSRITDRPDPGREVIVARFELPMNYCGVFENFSQFVGNEDSEPLARVATPGMEWRLLMNNRPLFPYLRLEHIVNPWGFSCCPVAIRLDENATVEFAVRNVSYNKTEGNAIVKVGGRITGRFWYNPAYGDAAPRGGRFG